MNDAIKVYNISPDEQAALRIVAQEKYQNRSLSALARTLLLAELEKVPPKPVHTDAGGKRRTELRLPPALYLHLKSEAQIHGMSASSWVTLLLQSRRENQPTLSNAELSALYASNYQLLRIGRNLNQIARHLNAGVSATFNRQHVSDLYRAIDAHTAKVGKLLQTAYGRKV